MLRIGDAVRLRSLPSSLRKCTYSVRVREKVNKWIIIEIERLEGYEIGFKDACHYKNERMKRIESIDKKSELWNDINKSRI